MYFFTVPHVALTLIFFFVFLIFKNCMLLPGGNFNKIKYTCIVSDGFDKPGRDQIISVI